MVCPHTATKLLTACTTASQYADWTLLHLWLCRKMSTAPGDRKSDVEGTPGAGGPKGAAELTGGYMNYVFIILNIALAWLGWVLLLASIIALQHQFNKDQNIEPQTNNWLQLAKDGGSQADYFTFAGYAINSGYPALQPGRILRFEW